MPYRFRRLEVIPVTEKTPRLAASLQPARAKKVTPGDSYWCYHYGVVGGLMGPLGFSEMLIIFIVALLVFGPKKLPELGKTLGKSMREFRKATDELKQTWEEQVKDIENPVKDISREIRQVETDMKSDFYGAAGTASEAAATETDTAAESKTAPESAESAEIQNSSELPQSDERAAPKEHV